MMIRVKIYLLILLFLQAGTRSEAQVCNNDTSFSCLINCFNLKAIIPDVRSTDDYSVISIPYCPYDFVTNAPAITPNCISFDDKYIDTTILPFRFCFYGQTYGKVIIGTNALITFDSLMALRGNNYTLTGNPIPFGGAGSIGSGNCPQPSGVNYPRASIFGAYSDIFPRSSDNFKIETRTIGVAPARIFIVSFSNVSMYGCTSQKFTSQIVIYEGTGVIDVHVQEKPTCAVTNANRAIIGIQNYARDMGVAAPGRNCQPFTATNESWRFTPNAGASRYNRVELYKNGTLVNTGTAVSVGNSKMEATFTNVCQPETNASYVVKAYYQDCLLPGEESEFHTQINVNKTAGPITATITPASCASNM
ncbi:MAG: hypothetical protein ABIQ56_02595, partial [Chitinophagaceae bacterium]